VSITAPASSGLRAELVAHLRENALRTDGPFTLRSGATSTWYLDARQTTFDGRGASLVGACVLEVLSPVVVAVGGMTMGADPIAVATAMAATTAGRPLRAFSIRKAEKDHGAGGRLVGPVGSGDRVAVVEDTTTTGGALVEAIQVLQAEGVSVSEAVTLVDRSDGTVAVRLEDLGIPFTALVVPAQLGVGS
jgi:orotate phosphoribosyltransferase